MIDSALSLLPPFEQLRIIIAAVYLTPVAFVLGCMVLSAMIWAERRGDTRLAPYGGDDYDSEARKRHGF